MWKAEVARLALVMLKGSLLAPVFVKRLGGLAELMFALFGRNS
jgi:hypothetical protein